MVTTTAAAAATEEHPGRPKSGSQNQVAARPSFFRELCLTDDRQQHHAATNINFMNENKPERAFC